ncbi:uncharacterized protein LOC122536288 [Frieseomelitta varia]|uniref:uncharacterized protein LOC122536288 n=1 Tax=Frieseomelitta varia TaxID=561572 RepID=UPI001CB6A7E5|nr:uncharacterized protein LOC122536288 [Frieseomelitta varia]
MRNDSFTRNETLSYEAQALQEILKINELMRLVHLNEEFQGDEKPSPRNYKSSEDEGNSSPDAREIHFRVTSRNISSPKGRDISSSTTSKNAESESVDSSGKERTPTLTKNDQSVKVDELDVLHSTMKENCARSNVKEENRRRVREVEDRSIGDALFSCPFELVEIYSNKMGKKSENDLDLAFDVNRQTCSMRAFPKEAGKQCQIEKCQLSASKIKSNKLKGETCTDKVDEHDDLQKECEEENCQNCSETVEEKFALNNSVINEDLYTKSNEDSQTKRKEENEDFQEPQHVLENDTSEATVVKLNIQDRENSIIDSRLENETTRINKQHPLDESFASTSEGAGANQDVNLITIFEATLGKPCVEKADEENDLNKCTNVKQTNHSSTFENNVKLRESCVKSDVIEDARSLERSEGNVISRNEEKEDVPTIKGQTDELRSANVSSIPRSLKRVAKNHDLFVKEKPSKSLKSSESVISAIIRIEEEASEENLRRDVVSIDNLNASENTDCSKCHKLANKVEENVSSTFKEENGQRVKMKCQRVCGLNAETREINAFGSNSLKRKAEGAFTFKGGHRNTETKCQKMSVDPRKLTIDGNLFEQCSVNSNERKLTEHSEFDDLKDSRSNLSSSLEDVNRQEEDLSKGNKINIIIEKRQSKGNSVVNKDVIGDNKNLLCNKDIRSSVIKNERTEERDSDDFYKEAKYETATRESRRIGINYESLNVCKVLTKIHERLTIDWQRMEQLRTKLQIPVSAELANPIIMLQLLDKTIARCKSYIHRSNNSHETELEMAKLLSKHVIELVEVVKVNRKCLEGQERRVNQMQSELVQGHYKKRTVLNEIIITSNYWANEVFRLIKNISCLVKRIVAENEEKENVRNLRSCKTQRRIPNSFFINDAKQKVGIVRSKNTKSVLVKKESTVETQMSADSNATKVLNSARYTEKEKRLDDVTDKRTADNCHHLERVKPAKRIMYTSSNQSKQTMSRQKYRASSNQPVWRPGGAAKIPTFNSVTTLVQKTRPAAHNRERTNLENARCGKYSLQCNGIEEKHERTASEFKKKPTTEVHSCRDDPKLNVDNSKVAGERSDVSLTISPRAKPRSRISRPLSKNFNESERPFTCVKNYARDTFHEKVTIESKALRALEEMIKTAENNEVKNVGNATRCSFQNRLANETCPADPRKTGESTAVDEEMKVNDEEPTRDIDSEQCKKSQLNERFQGNLPEKGEHSLIPIAPNSLTPVPSTEKDTENVGTNENFRHIPSEDLIKPNVSLEAATSCRILDFNTMSVETDEVEAWRSSECKDEKSNEMKDSSFPGDNEKQQRYDNLSIVKPEKARMNSHGVSLSMLKRFLYDQGIDVDLVSKAERYLKDKRKARKGLRKKSISIADVSSCVGHDRRFEKKTVLRKEHSWAEELEKDIKKYVKKRDDRKWIENDVEKNIDKYTGNDTKADVERSRGEIPFVKTRDVTTCTIKNSNDACTQTVPCRTASKCSQTVFKNDGSTTEETQTIAKRRNACTMTESLPIGDNSAETAKICCESAITERLGDDSRNISTGIKRWMIISENESEDSKLKIRRDPKGSEPRGRFREDSTNKIDKTSSRECSLVFQTLLRQTEEEHEESNSSTTRRSSSSESSKRHDLDENASEEEDRSPVRIVSSGIVAAVQVAAIRARNVYRAFDIHKRILRSNRKKLRRESRQRMKLREEEHASRGVNFEKRAARRGNDSKMTIVEVLKNLERAEITSRKEFFDDSRNESDHFEDDLDLVDTPSTSASSSRISFKSIDLDIPRRSSSSVVLRNVRSLMDLLLSETDDVTLERIERRVAKRSSTRETKFSGTVRMEVANVNGFLFFSRENLLLLVYGMLCSVVFWCLNFTITCDVAL